MVRKMMEHPSTQIQFRLRHQGTWTYEDWLKFPDDGWKYEILAGELYLTPPPATGHQRASVKLVIKMGSYVEAHDLGEVLEAPCGVRLPTQAVPLQPDIFFIKKENLDIIAEDEIKGVPDLMIEILSPSNAGYDRTKKFAIYQEAGVPEYWPVDYQAKTVEVFVLTEGVYQLTSKYELGDTVVSGQLPGFKIAVETIFNF